MSIENVAALMTAARTDSALASALRKAVDPAELQKIGAERGYDFTMDELATYVGNLPSQELDDQALEAVAGGGTGESAHVAISLGDGTTIEAAGSDYGVGSFGDGSVRVGRRSG